MNNHVHVISPSAAARSKSGKRITARRVASKHERQATGLVRELFAVFQQDHGQTLREVRETKSEVRERVLKAAPGIAKRLDLLDRVEKFLHGMGGDA